MAILNCTLKTYAVGMERGMEFYKDTEASPFYVCPEKPTHGVK